MQLFGLQVDMLSMQGEGIILSNLSESRSASSNCFKGMTAEEFQVLRTNLHEKGVKLIAVSKMKTPSQILEVYQWGQRIFAENRVQDLIPKYNFLPKDIEWHMIGHLQKNKVKYIVPFISMIQSVDSLGLLQEIEKRATKAGRVIDFLFQLRIAREETKYGLSESDLMRLLESKEYRQMRHVRACGVMGIATLTEDERILRQEFRRLKAAFDNLRKNYFSDDVCFREISMGMSGDFEIAIEEGSTMVRLGTLIFGERLHSTFTPGEL
ncbi:MAG: YggS family pyridoxal phosphate enzyme [Chitinophagales bacterium]|nr:MAG: YggS family pyridoxal phosphate enzyme [Chitinophagales bacterium]